MPFTTPTRYVTTRRVDECVSCYAQRNVAVRGRALLSDARAVSMHRFVRVSMFSIFFRLQRA